MYAHENWMNPLNKMIWAKAFKDGKTECKVRDGRVFTIEYKTVPIYGEPTKCAWIKQKDTIDGPCGWFVMAKVLSPMWVTSDEKEVSSPRPMPPTPKQSLKKVV